MRWITQNDPILDHEGKETGRYTNTPYKRELKKSLSKRAMKRLGIYVKPDKVPQPDGSHK